MPSILATAAMAALAGAGGRKLDASGVDPCTHDICGRKLLARATTHGDPVAISSQGGRSYNFGDEVPGYNGVFVGYEDVKVTRNGDGKIVVTATMDATTYPHAERQCELHVTPSIVENNDVTSKTFHPATGTDADGNAITYVSVSGKDDTSYDANAHTFEVVLDDPATDDKSLGYLGVDIGIKLECTDPALYDTRAEADGGDAGKTRAELATEGKLKDYNVFLDYAAQDKVRVRHKFEESSATTLPLYGGVNDGLVAVSTFGSGNLAVAVTGSATLTTEADRLRFPQGEWATFGQASTLNQIDCTVEQDVEDAYKLDGWYDASAGAAQPAISYDAGVDSDCAGGVCQSRTHSATISYNTDIGFQVPLSNYFKQDSQPTIQCVDGAAGDAKSFAVDIDGSSACDYGDGFTQCKLGDVSRGLALGVGGATTTDFGDDLFGDQDAIAARGNFFTIAQKDATPWYDLDDFYDYTFDIKSTAAQCSDLACDSPTSSEKTELATGGDSLQIALQGSSIGAVQSTLSGKVAALAPEISRPVKYGETRDAYTITNPPSDATNKAQKGITIRRDGSDIRVDISANADAGTVTYVEDPFQGDPVFFLGPGLPWRTDLGDATLQSGTYQGTATASDVVVASIDANTLDFFKAQTDVTEDLLFDQTVDDSEDSCDKAYCESPDGGNAWRCSAQSATWQLQVGKESLDSREANTAYLTKLYSVAAQQAQNGSTIPANPTIAASTTVNYRIAGSSAAMSHPLKAQSVDTGETNVLTFGIVSNSARPFDCSTSASQIVQYSATYRQPCDKASASIAYSEPYAMVYSLAQVAPSAAGLTTATFSEYILQREGKDITFTVTPSSFATYGLPFNQDTLRVEVFYKGNSKGNAQCTVGNSGVATCTLSGFKDADYDAAHALSNDETCGAGTLPCPQLSLKIYEKFAIPDITLANMFKPDSVDSGAVCGDASVKEHLISGDLTIDVLVDGSEQAHRSGVQFFSNGNADAFASLAEDASTKATGSTSEYKSTIPVNADSTTLEVANLDADLTNLKLLIDIEGEPGAHDITNLGTGYEIKRCNNPGNFDQCDPTADDYAVLDFDQTGVQPGAMAFTVVVRALDGGDPCQDKILGAPAYDGGIRFSVRRQDESQAHEYTLPIPCHVERGVKVASQQISASTDAWNDILLDVTLTGSAIDYRKELALTSADLGNALRIGDGLYSDLSAKIARQAPGDGALTARLTLDYIQDATCQSGVVGALEWDSVALQEGDAAAETTLQCPVNALGIEINGQAIQAGARISAATVGSDFFKTFGDIFMIDMVMTGRDANMHDANVDVMAEGNAETVRFLGGNSQQINHKGDEDGSSKVYFKIVPPQDSKITCSLLTIKLSARTTSSQSDEEKKDFSFRVECPRQNSAEAASDKVYLEYGVEKLEVRHAETFLNITADPAEWTGDPSKIVFGKCENGVATEKDATCQLVAGNQKLGGTLDPKSVTGVLNLFDHCDGSTQWNEDGKIVSTVKVARSYAHVDEYAGFGTSNFCSETPLHIEVQKDANKAVTIAVAANLDMDFDVQVAQAEWRDDACTTDGEYQLITAIDMQRKLLPDGAWSNKTIESYSRASALFTSFHKTDGTELTTAFEDGGSQLIAKSDCKVPTATEHQVSFTMKVHLSGVDYYSAASVAMSVSAPDTQDAEYDHNIVDFAESLGVDIGCATTQTDIVSNVCDSPADEIPANYNVELQLTLSVQEETAFDHQIGEPRIQVDGNDALSAAACDLHEDCSYVSQLPTGTYQAIGAGGAQILLVSADKKTVTLKALPFSNNEVQVGWVVSRVHSSGRRLRAVEHVTYTLGADGSVSKSSTFAVAPAVRDTDGASVITTKQEIIKTYEDGSTTTYNETIKEHEKSGEDHTLAILGIVFGGLGSVAAIAVAFFVGCASRRDASGAGSSFKTVSGGFSDRQPLFNRNRFAPVDF